MWIYTSIPLRLHGVVLNKLSKKTNFTFFFIYFGGGGGT
jgi:hypothetical protein